MAEAFPAEVPLKVEDFLRQRISIRRLQKERCRFTVKRRYGSHSIDSSTLAEGTLAHQVVLRRSLNLAAGAQVRPGRLGGCQV